MKSKKITSFNNYKLPQSSQLKIKGGATEELFGAYHFLTETEFEQGNDKVVRKKPGRTTY